MYGQCLGNIGTNSLEDIVLKPGKAAANNKLVKLISLGLCVKSRDTGAKSWSHNRCGAFMARDIQDLVLKINSGQRPESAGS